MKKMIVAAIAAALVLILCSCEPGIFYPITTDAPETAHTSEIAPVTEEETQPPETEPLPVTTEAETEAPVTETGEYSVIHPSIAASKDNSGTLWLYSDNTYKALLTTYSSELGAEAKTEVTEYGAFETSNGSDLVCTASEIRVKISYQSESDKEEALKSLQLLEDIDIVDFTYVASYKKACGENGYSATVAEAKADMFLSTFAADEVTKISLDKEKSLAYDVTVKYDLPAGQYRIEKDDCILTLDPDGRTGECTLEFPLTGDDGDGLGRYTMSTVLKGTYVRTGSHVTCTVTGEITFLKYDSAESQQKYLASLEESYANGEIIEEVYNYNKSVASEEGRYIDYGSETDEYGVYVIDVTHAAVFTSTPSQEYYE